MDVAKKAEYEEYIHSEEWQLIRIKAFEKYGRKCCHCGSEEKLHVHHNTYVHFKNENLSELRILCETCHMALHERINNISAKRKVKKTLAKINKQNRKKKKKEKQKIKKEHNPNVNKFGVLKEEAEHIRLHNETIISNRKRTLNKKGDTYFHVGIGATFIQCKKCSFLQEGFCVKYQRIANRVRNVCEEHMTKEE